MTLLLATTTAAPLKVRDYLIPGSSRYHYPEILLINYGSDHLQADQFYLRKQIFITEEIGTAKALQMRCSAGNNRASEASVKGGVLGSGVLGGRMDRMSSYFFIMRDIHND